MVKQLGIYGGFFVLMLGVALAATGVLQQGILPRILGSKAAPAAEAKAPGKPQEPGGGEPPPEAKARPNPQPATPLAPTEAAKPPAKAAEPKAAKPDPAKAQAEQLKELEGRITQQREALGAEEKRLLELKAAIEDLGKRHEGAVKEREGKDAEKVQRLARLYEAMKPKDAAVVLEKMDRSLALEILAAMKDGKASKVLSAIQPGTAAELSKRLGPPLEDAKAGSKERGKAS
jgi:flagellar motility protein MotE (MotC chaperone)